MIEYAGKELIIMACSNCNIKCKHCYISYNGNRNAEELLNIVKKLSPKYNININGAELLTNLDYLKSLKEIGQHYLMSNGKAFVDNPKIIDTLKLYEINSVSLSYHFGIHSDISFVSCDALERIIKFLQSNDIDVRLLTTVTSKNYDGILKICDYAKSLMVRGIKFTNFLSQGNAKNMASDSVLTDEQKKIFFEQIHVARTKYAIEELLIERCGTFGRDTYLAKNNFKCNCQYDSVVLTPDNKIYPCVFLASPGFEIGKYENDKILIYDEFENDYEECLADRICNQKINIKRRNL